MSGSPGSFDDNTGVPLVSVRSEPAELTGRHASHSEGASQNHSRSTSGGRSAHAPRNPSHLRRSGSLTQLSYGHEPSAHSLPQPLRRVEIDLNNSDHDHSPNRLERVLSPASLQNVRQVLHRVTHSDPSPSRPGSAENSPSYQPVPLRLFWPLNRIHSREEPFVPVNPYRNRFHIFSAQEFEEELLRKRAALEHVPVLLRHICLQTYLHALLRLPSMYFSRVSRIFEEAEVTRPEMQRMIDGVADGLDLTHDWAPPNVSHTLARFKESWEDFVDTVVQEWKTFNVVSALLLSAILTMFQIDDANNQVIVRTASLLSLICAAWSLIYGGIYIMRFRTMRSMYKASVWAQEAQKTRTNMVWNVWVLLALPAIWLAWAMIAFFAAILAFVWTSGSSADNPQPPPRHVELAPRVVITAMFMLGLVYFVLVVRTFKSYGAPRPRARPTTGPVQGTSRQAANGGNANVGTPDPILGANSNSLGLNFGGTNGNLRGSSMGIISRETDLEKGERSVEDRGRRVRESPGIGGLDF
ncbi:hypothetical protein M0805_006433 [Coniferiporia weirii]|nr:hypothetical protein M0805_006433 [Coniferiporia weirii]